MVEITSPRAPFLPLIPLRSARPTRDSARLTRDKYELQTIRRFDGDKRNVHLIEPPRWFFFRPGIDTLHLRYRTFGGAPVPIEKVNSALADFGFFDWPELVIKECVCTCESGGFPWFECTRKEIDEDLIKAFPGHGKTLERDSLVICCRGSGSLWTIEFQK